MSRRGRAGTQRKRHAPKGVIVWVHCSVAGHGAERCEASRTHVYGNDPKRIRPRDRRRWMIDKLGEAMGG